MDPGLKSDPSSCHMEGMANKSSKDDANVSKTYPSDTATKDDTDHCCTRDQAPNAKPFWEYC